MGQNIDSEADELAGKVSALIRQPSHYKAPSREDVDAPRKAGWFVGMRLLFDGCQACEVHVLNDTAICILLFLEWIMFFLSLCVKRVQKLIYEPLQCVHAYLCALHHSFLSTIHVNNASCDIFNHI